MTDHFRYLPCALHPALYADADDRFHVAKGRPFKDYIDLTHPAGWDHAVRALVVMQRRDIVESTSYWFGVDPHRSAGWCVQGEINIILRFSPADDADDEFSGRRVPGLTDDPPSTTPTSRREALCRCICAALGVDVDQVFPLEKA